ncbi:MAG: hypothetical protein KJ000_34740 [Pirellulaceae bacterium]|nr:hypothetical protein [Pirellulaceae bacterium]
MVHTTKTALDWRMGLLLAATIVLANTPLDLAAQDAIPPGFRAYSLHHAQAGEVAPQLQKMLDELGARQEVLIDRTGNRLLIRGPEQSAGLTDQLVQTLDRPPAVPVPAAVASPTQPTFARGYAVEPGSAEAVLAQLRGRFPADSGFRAATDARTGQIIVVAPEAIHAQVATMLPAPRGASPLATGQTLASPVSPMTTTPGVTRQVHSLRHVTWQELEEELARLWGRRLLRSTSRDGEVATIHAQGADGPYPIIKIDRRSDSVSFLGTADVAQGWSQIVRMLDQPQANDSQQTRLVAVEKADPQQIRQTVAMIQDASREAAEAGNDAIAMVFQQPGEPAAPAAQPTLPAAEPAQPAPGAAPGGQAAPVGDETDFGGVLGPVQIEYIEGLDVIVLRGNRRDVERLQKIIGDIERLSQETLPLIEIHPLRFVGSQVMAQLVSEIYNEILSPRQGVVTIRPLVKPNAMLLIGRTDSVTIVKELIVKLDQPVAAESQFEVFQLKHVSALDAQETISAFFVDRMTQAQVGTQAQGLRPGLGTRVNVVADYRSNQLIVQASARDMDEVRRLITRIDVETSGATNELKIFRLKNALASDIAPVLQDALNWQLIGNRTPVGATTTGFGAGVGQAEERARIRSAILTFMTIDSEGNKLLESGLLSDVRVTADVNGNALIVTGPSKSMGLIAALVKELDTLPSAQAQIKVFTIVNGDATSLSTMLQQLLSQTTQATQQFGGAFGQGTLNPFLAPALQAAAASGEGTLVPVRFGVDQRTNSIIATGSEGDLGVVEVILMRLDEQSLRKQQTVVYWLANAPATEVATAVNNWLTQRTQQFQQQVQISPESPTIRINREIIVVAETISNSIIISAAPDLIEEIKRVVESLDRRPPMVKIDVLIAEVALTDFFEFGAEYGLQDGLLFNRDSATGNPPVGYNFNNIPLGNTGGVPGNVLAQGLSSFGMGRVSGEQGYGGLVLSASSHSISVLIRALQERGRLQILSRPTITTLDSQPALVNVGATVSRLAGTVLNNNNSQQNIEDVDTGIILGVTPRVTPEGIIVMEVDATKSKLSDTEGVQLPTGGVDGGTFFQPNIDIINASTTVSARSGQTVVFAGLITTTKADVRRGIPWLSDLPVVGPMFAFRNKVDRRSELLIVLTPRVIHGNEDQEIDWIKYAETERMSWCLADVAQMYDTNGMTARPGLWCDCPDMVTIYPDTCPTGMPLDMPLETPTYPGPVEQMELQPTPSEATPSGAGAAADAAYSAPRQPVAPAAYSPQPQGPAAYAPAPYAAASQPASHGRHPAAAPGYSAAPAYYEPRQTAHPQPVQQPAPYGVPTR